MYPELANEMSTVAGAALGAGLINGLIVGRSFKLLRFVGAGLPAKAAE